MTETKETLPLLLPLPLLPRRPSPAPQPPLHPPHVAAEPAHKARVDAAAASDAVVAIALSEGHSFSPATFSRFTRG